MNADGFEALADGVLLFVVLALAIGAVLTWGGAPPTDDGAWGAAYAEDVRLALFRTPLDGLGYEDDGAFVVVPAGTTVETFLRIEVHVRSEEPSLDFSAANARVAALAASLLRPGWAFLLVGGEPGGPEVVRIPDVRPPPTRFESAWTYPSLDGAGPGVRLAFAAWLSPR